jgi:hypothetical protein
MYADSIDGVGALGRVMRDDEDDVISGRGERLALFVEYADVEGDMD